MSAGGMSGNHTEKWERSRRNLEEKIKAKKKFIEQQNIIQKTALAKGENLKSADAQDKT